MKAFHQKEFDNLPEHIKARIIANSKSSRDKSQHLLTNGDVIASLNTIGKVAKTLRQHLKITQEELAEKSRLSRPVISRIETDNYPNPSLKTLKFLATGLEIDYEVLMLLSMDVSQLSLEVEAKRHQAKEAFIEIWMKNIAQ